MKHYHSRKSGIPFPSISIIIHIYGEKLHPFVP